MVRLARLGWACQPLQLDIFQSVQHLEAFGRGNKRLKVTQSILLFRAAKTNSTCVCVRVCKSPKHSPLWGHFAGPHKDKGYFKGKQDF
jgi:hypothetical protein